jgi:hypothetical protein
MAREWCARFPFVFKDSWRYGKRPSEGELLEKAKNAGIKGIAIHLAHCDHEETVHTILGPCREAFPAKAGPGAEAIIIPNRFRTLVVMSRGRAITQFGTTLELLRSYPWPPLAAHYRRYSPSRRQHQQYHDHPPFIPATG